MVAFFRCPFPIFSGSGIVGLSSRHPRGMKRRIAGAREVEFRLGREVSGHAITPFVAVTTPKGKLWMELDTGSDGSIVIGNHNAELFSMKADDPSPQRFQSELAGGVPLASVDARSMPLVIDGNIGMPILRNWILTMDLAHSRAWISSASSDD